MSKKKNKKLDVGYHVVAFVDLMGQQERLRELVRLPDDGDSEAYQELVQTLKATYGAVNTLRSSLQKYVRAFEERKSDARALSPQERSLFRQLTSNPIRFHQFSDFVTAFLSMRTDLGAKVPAKGIMGLLGATATASVIGLASGHPIRGGIEIGLNLDIKHNEIYGAAIARAYALESHVANYPRIVVGPELISYLEFTRDKEKDGPEAAISSIVAQQCLDMICVDDDGYPFVDFLGPAIRNSLEDNDASTDISRDIVTRAYEFVVSSSMKFKEEKNTKLAFKYTLLRNYMESRLELWGVQIS